MSGLPPQSTHFYVCRRLTFSPGDALRARPATCGALGRASVNSGAPRTNGAQTHVDPFHREVPESKERGTQKGKRQIKRAIPAQGRVRRELREESLAAAGAEPDAHAGGHEVVVLGLFHTQGVMEESQVAKVLRVRLPTPW